MIILVTNDDGIDAVGIQKLAEMAKNLGEVWVVAPDKQCSAMSQRIHVRGELIVHRRKDFPVEGVQAFSVSGTPADCVKIALMEIMPQKPDIVFSGINIGYNVGQDILYSGTVGAAVEALSNEIPAIAFSSDMNGGYDVVDEYMLSITKDLLNRPLPANALWNVNFPGCKVSECKGILEDRIPATHQYYLDHFIRREISEDSFALDIQGVPVTEAAEGTDIRAVMDNYISIGVVRNGILPKNF